MGAGTLVARPPTREGRPRLLPLYPFFYLLLALLHLLLYLRPAVLHLLLYLRPSVLHLLIHLIPYLLLYLLLHSPSARRRAEYQNESGRQKDGEPFSHAFPSLTIGLRYESPLAADYLNTRRSTAQAGGSPPPILPIINRSGHRAKRVIPKALEE